jgi:hypothetical protein
VLSTAGRGAKTHADPASSKTLACAEALCTGMRSPSPPVVAETFPGSQSPRKLVSCCLNYLSHVLVRPTAPLIPFRICETRQCKDRKPRHVGSNRIARNAGGFGYTLSKYLFELP